MRKSNSLLMMAASAAMMSGESFPEDSLRITNPYAGLKFGYIGGGRSNHKFKFPNQRQKRKMWAQNPSLRRK